MALTKSLLRFVCMLVDGYNGVGVIPVAGVGHRTWGELFFVPLYFWFALDGGF